MPDFLALDNARTRTRPKRTIVHTAKTSTRPVNIGAARVDPIKSLLRERKKESRTGGGIDALNCAEGYDHDALLSDFSVDEVDEPADDTRSSLADENITCRTDGTEKQDDNVAASTLEEVHREERERLLGAKEGEAVGRILDADRKLGQTAAHSVLGVAVFDSDYDGNVETEVGSNPRPIWEPAEGKTTTLALLSDAIEQQGV